MILKSVDDSCLNYYYNGYKIMIFSISVIPPTDIYCKKLFSFPCPVISVLVYFSIDSWILYLFIFHFDVKIIPVSPE